MRKGVLTVISGFSGAGKGTLIRKLLERHDNYVLSVSKTTRAPREGEVDGVSYFFTTVEDFEELAAHDGFLEHAQYCGNRYGTPRAFVEEQLAKGKDVLLEIEMQGALQIRERFPDALLIYVMTPDAEDLRIRLAGRGTESAEKVKERLRRAVAESDGIEAYEYIIVNDEVERAAEELHGVILASRCAVKRNLAFIRKTHEKISAMYTD
ncbi:MAG: guanylate kinase [Lachnospiraceae bacterium]|nr:guanylate kinase [Lachnospiraceae bacterium]